MKNTNRTRRPAPVAPTTIEEAEAAARAVLARQGLRPVYFSMRGTGIVSEWTTEAEARNAADLFRLANFASVSVYFDPDCEWCVDAR